MDMVLFIVIRNLYIIMKKIFILMILGIFLTSCSNIGKEKEILKGKENLIVLIRGYKNNLQKGETEL